MSINLVAQ